MKYIIGFVVLLLLSGCSVVELFKLKPVVDSAVTAQTYVGLQEREHRHEIKQLIGVDPVRVEWCAAFVNAILELDGIPSLNSIGHPYPLTARGFLTWGSPVEIQDIRRGDIVVFPRGNQGWQGHVGFFVASVTVSGQESWIILGGNQDQSVSYAFFRPHQAIGIRRYITPLAP